MSIRKGSRTIASSVPVTEWGSVDGTLADQADLKSALDSKAPTYSPTFTGTPIAPTAPIDTSNNQIATTKYVQDALLASETTLPEQSGNAGKFLTTDGQIPSWANIPAEIPSQSGQSGKFLTTNGTSASWSTLNSVVHLTGDETINGVKTFNDAIYRSGDVTTAAGSGIYVYRFDDTNSTSSGYIHNKMYYTGNQVINRLFSKNNTSNKDTYIDIIARNNGTSRISVGGSSSCDNLALVESGTSSLVLASMGWVNDPTKSTNVVHRSGDETITGVKTFSTGDGGTSVKLKSTTIDKTVNPESNKYIYMDCLDKNNVRLGVVGSIQFPNGLYGSYLQAGNEGQIRILTDGTNVSTHAPTPSSVTDNTTKIATTEWVINVLQALYPVGSLYMGTQNSCPLSAFFGTWTLVSAGNALWTGNGTSGSGTTRNTNYANATANTTIAAGVPNIKDNFYFVDTYYGSVALAPNSDNGLIKYNSKTTSGETNRSDTDGTTTSRQKYVFDASQVNSIYGTSTTVQPPAYVVNVWRRTA